MCGPILRLRLMPVTDGFSTSSTIWMDEDGRLRPIPVHYQGSSSGNLVSVFDTIHVRGRVIWWLPNRGLLLLPTMGACMPAPFAPKGSLRSVLWADLYGPVARQASCRSISRHAIARCSLLILCDKGQNFFCLSLFACWMSMAGLFWVIRRDLGFFAEHLPNLAAPAYLAFL